MKRESAGRNRRILVIDDNASIHADFRKILAGAEQPNTALARAEAELFGDAGAARPERPAFELKSAFQGQDGVALAQEAVQSGQPFALVFVDVRMPPGWDGIETTARLWAVDPDVQIVICTAYSDYSWDDMITQLGTSDRMVILKKPFDAVEVLQLANALTEKWTLLQQSKLRFQDLQQRIAASTTELRSANEKLQNEIREHQIAEQVLRTTQEKLNHFLAKSPAVLFSFKIEAGQARPDWVSDNFQSFTGRPLADWHQQAELEFVEAGEQAQVQKRLETLLAGNHGSFQYRVRRQDGSLRWVRDDRQLLRNAAGEPTEIIGCWTDITDQRALEDELRQSQKMESVGLLAGGVAHDFNNMLMVIRCHVELLINQGGLPESTTQPLQRILATSDRAANLTRQLLAFSRKQVMRLEDLDPTELIQSLTKLLGRTLGEHIVLETQCAQDLPAIHADRGMMEQVIMNLAVNARDAMPKGGTLTMTTSVETVEEAHRKQHPEARLGRYVRLSISDTGTGISQENLARIFEPFFTTKQVGKGTGLGLATVYGIVQQHDGWVEVTSGLGEGTRFDVYLAATNRRVAEPANTGPAATATGGSETILVVEDEPALRSLVRSILQRQGYRVYTAASGVEALKAWSRRLDQIDLLLTDLVMPDGLSGWELARELQREKPELKAIYMSGYSAEASGQEAVDLTRVRLLAKPFGARVLTEAVRGCLDESDSETADKSEPVGSLSE